MKTNGKRQDLPAVESQEHQLPSVVEEEKQQAELFKKKIEGIIRENTEALSTSIQGMIEMTRDKDCRVEIEEETSYIEEE